MMQRINIIQSICVRTHVFKHEILSIYIRFLARIRSIQTQTSGSSTLPCTIRGRVFVQTFLLYNVYILFIYSFTLESDLNLFLFLLIRHLVAIYTT